VSHCSASTTAVYPPTQSQRPMTGLGVINPPAVRNRTMTSLHDFNACNLAG